MRSEKVPCGFSSTCTSPLSTSCSNSLFSPTYVEIIFLIWRFCRSKPRPAPSVPALLLATVRFFVPLRRRASIRCSGTPQRPKPPTRMVAPLVSLAMAASAEAMRLSMAVCKSGDAANCPDEECTASRTGVVAVRKVASGEVTGGRERLQRPPTPGVLQKGCKLLKTKEGSAEKRAKRQKRGSKFMRTRDLPEKH